MIRHTAPYGAGASVFSPSPAPSVAFGAPARPAGLSAPFPVTSGPGVGASRLGLPFPTDGFYHDARGPGWPTNNTVPHHYITLPDAESAISSARHRELGEYMLCFARNPTGAPPDGRRHRFELPEEANTVELLEVNMLNEWLRDNTLDRKREPYYKNADELLREWKLLGVIKTEVAPNRPNNYGERATSRVMNLIVNGRVPTFNLWGGEVQAGADLYFLVRKEMVVGQKGVPSKVAWTIRPYTSRIKQRPGPEELRNADGDGFGRWIYVGKAGESIFDGTPPAEPLFSETLKGRKLTRYLQLHLKV